MCPLPLLPRAGFKLLRLGLISCFAIFASLSAFGATVVLTGDTIVYEYDSLANTASLAAFGTPTISGDTVTFAPPSFRADSINGVAQNTPPGGTDIVVANFIFSKVYSISGAALASLEVIEFGDYDINNGGSVELDLLLSAANTDYLPPVISDSANIFVSGDTGGQQTFLTSAMIFPVSQFLTGEANEVQVSIQNELTATTANNLESAFIQKKFSFVATSEIPLPAAAWLFGSALVGLAGLAKRKTS